MANPISTSIKLVTFDAGGTLLHPYPSVGAVYQKVLKQHGLDYPIDALNENVSSAFRTISKDSSILDGESRELSFWKDIVAASIAPFKQQPKNFDNLFHDLWNEFSSGSCWRVSEGTHETLQALKDAGPTIALLTNWDGRVHNVIRETELSPYFDHSFVSSEIGLEKPDLQIFRHVENATGISSNQILHIGDSIKHDIVGATEAGWNALLIDPEGLLESDVPTISTLSQILDYI